MFENAAILTPVIVLIAWSMIMWCWMFAVRLPALKKASIKMDPQIPRGVQMSGLPSEVRWKADNYNHLMEQPTIFYALAISLALLDSGTGINLYLAWAYVGIRIIHSLYQALVNVVEIRFLLFVLSNIPLAWMVVNALLKVFGR